LNRQNLLANQAQGAVGKRPHNLSRPDLLGWIFQVTLVRKSKIVERRKTQTTALTARLYEIDFIYDEPLPEI